MYCGRRRCRGQRHDWPREASNGHHPTGSTVQKQKINAGLVKECPKCLRWFPFTGHSSTAADILPELEFDECSIAGSQRLPPEIFSSPVSSIRPLATTVATKNDPKLSTSSCTDASRGKSRMILRALQKLWARLAALAVHLRHG